MRRFVFQRIPRIISTTAHSPLSHPPPYAVFRSRFLSTAPPLPPSPSPSPSPNSPVNNSSPVSIDSGSPVSQEAIETTLNAPHTDISEAATAIATSDTQSLSDTLLQPAMALLSGMHEVSGLPWWISIALSTLTIRTVLLPVTLMTMHSSAKMAALKGDIAERREAVMEAVRSGNRSAASEKQNEMQQFMRHAGVAPMKVLIGPLVQFPVFISFFVGLRRLAQSEPGFVDGGVGWFVDLATRDPTFLLPLLCGASLVAMTELGGDTGSATMSKQMRMVMRGVAMLSVPMTYWFPSAVFCYWIPNNLFSIALGSAVRTRALKRLLGLEVDLKAIKGTRAAKEYSAKLIRERGGGMGGERMDQAVAAASYMKGGASAAGKGHTVKPVLLKQRPVKKKINTTN